MSDLPNAAVKRILIKGGAERVGASAIGIASNAAEDFLMKLAEEASLHAKQSKRKTIQDADVEYARQKLLLNEGPGSSCMSC